jgi:hypothetical protein
MKGSRCDGDDSESETSVHECIIEIFAFKWWHASIFSRFPIEYQIDGEEGTTEDTRTVEESLA